MKRMEIVGSGVAAALALGGCASSEGSQEYAMAEGHFSAECPSGEMPALTEVAHSGAIPEGPDDNAASAVVRLACHTSEQTPVITQDDRKGLCLGYGDEGHLTIRAEQPGEQKPEFFVNDRGEVGVTGSDKLAITQAGIHRHDLDNPLDKDDFERNNCDQFRFDL